MIDINNIVPVVCVALGFALGILSGLTPGLHLNNFAAMLATEKRVAALAVAAPRSATIATRIDRR